ncbi:MAG: SprB repeat-containing protein [Cytophagales bacterium]
MFENDNYDDIVNEYINGSLNDSQIADFEKVLATNETLQTELKKAQLIQKLTQSHKLTQIHSLLEEESAALKNKKTWMSTGLIALAVIGSGAGIYIYNTPETTDIPKPTKPKHESELKKTVDSIDSESTNKIIEPQKENNFKVQHKNIGKKDSTVNTVSDLPKTEINIAKIAPINLQKNEKDNEQPHNILTKTEEIAPIDCDKVKISAQIKIVKSCDNDGQIVVSQPTGGMAPYNYTLNNSVKQKSGNFVNLAEGTYKVTITDQNNCKSDIEDVVVPQALCNLVYDIKSGDTWYGPEINTEADLVILDKTGKIVFSQKLTKETKIEWNGRDLNNLPKIGYFVFILSNQNHEIARGSITITE